VFSKQRAETVVQERGAHSPAGAKTASPLTAPQAKESTLAGRQNREAHNKKPAEKWQETPRRQIVKDQHNRKPKKFREEYLEARGGERVN